MNKITYNNIVPVSNNYNVLCNPNLSCLQNLNTNLSIIYFTDCLTPKDKIFDIINNGHIQKIVVVNPQKSNINNSKFSFCTKVNSHIIKSLNRNILIIINMNDNFNYIKSIINNLKSIIYFSNKYDKKICMDLFEASILLTIYSNNSIFYTDLINCIKALLIDDKRNQYEFVYDTVCDYLDNQFNQCNLCDFKNDQCIANRTKSTKRETMGCCYSFDYAGFFDYRLIKNVKLCQYMQNRACATKNITCKLFTCKYLKNKNIQFDSHKILLLECFFDKKQHDIMQSNFFRTREEILNKLQEKNHDFYFWYLCFKKYRIKKG